ncbi:MAG: hypothetical protein IJ410_06285 [Oscillospiraceae bacterium]|nr:hypothetical protein [Oscillospiraceae bacterium]
MSTVLIFIFVFTAVYLLYISGIGFYSSKRAVTFIGKSEKDCLGASFTGCSGVTKKVIKTKETKEFMLHKDIHKGEIYVTVTARDKSAEYRFDDMTAIHTVPRGRYTVTTGFDCASGSYSLQWK